MQVENREMVRTSKWSETFGSVILCAVPAPY